MERLRLATGVQVRRGARLASIAFAVGGVAVVALVSSAAAPTDSSLRLPLFTVATLLLLVFYSLEHFAVKGLAETIKHQRPELLRRYGYEQQVFSWIAKYRKLLRVISDPSVSSDRHLASAMRPLQSLIWMSFLAFATWFVALLLVGEYM